MIFVLAFVQAVTSAPPQTIDLSVKGTCNLPSSSDADVVVCGRRGSNPDRYRIKPLADLPTQWTKAEFNLSDRVSAAAETENVDVGGRPSNRVMLRLKIKF